MDKNCLFVITIRIRFTLLTLRQKIGKPYIRACRFFFIKNSKQFISGYCYSPQFLLHIKKKRAECRFLFSSGCAYTPVMVEVTGLEPTTSWSLTKRATKLRYTSFLTCFTDHCRSHDLLVLVAPLATRSRCTFIHRSPVTSVAPLP